MEEVITPQATKKSIFDFLHSRFIVNALIFLVPTFFIPLAVVPFQFSKTLVALVALVALLAVFLVVSAKRSSVTLHWSPLLISVWLLPLVYLVSSIFSQSPALSFFGYQLETDTFGFMLLAAALVTAVVATHKREDLSGTFKSLLYASWAVFVFQLIQVLFNTPFPLATLSDPIVNSVGRWNDFGIFAGLVGVLVLLTYLSMRIKKKGEIALIVTFALALSFMALVNLTEVWIVFGVVSLALSIMVLGQLRHGGIAALGLGRLLLPLIGLVVSIAFVLFGANMIAPVQNVLGINSFEVRPSVSGTFSVLEHVYAEHPVLGAGPNTFVESWLLHRPDGVLTSIFWNTPFNAGSGFIPTAFINGGIVVALAWLILSGFILYTVLRALFATPIDVKSYMYTTLAGLGLVYLLVLHYLYTPSKSITLLLVLFLSMFLVSLKDTPLVRKITVEGSTPAKYYALIVVGVFVAIVSLVLVYGIARTYASSIYHGRAIQTANAGNLSQSETLVKKAIALRAQDRYYRTAALINSAQLNQILASQEATDEARTAFQTALSKAIENANAAKEKNPNSYDNWMTRAGIFAAVVPLNVEGALENAVANLEEARARNPKTPEVDYQLAQLQIASDASDQARSSLEAALAKKANYTAAILLLAQIDLDEGNLKDAIESVRAAVFFEPQNSVLLYQLGILLLQDKNYEQAAAAFELSLQNQPDYANAAFFLAQSYAFLDRTEDAIPLMQELKRTNPENEIVGSYLEALEAGENPFNPKEIASPEEDSEEIQ